MDKRQPFTSLFRWGYLLLMNVILCHSVQRWQGICSYVLAGFQMKCKKRFHRFFGNCSNRLHSNKTSSLFPSFHGD